MRIKYLAILLSVSILFGLRPVLAQSTLNIEEMMQERVLGDPEAPVTIYEYSSFTCPHCAAFHAETLPDLRTNYIDTGKVKLVFRDFPLEVIALHGSLLARCSATSEQFFRLVEVVFREQRSWVNEEPEIARDNLIQIGLRAGINENKLRQCLSSQDTADQILIGYRAAQRQYQISSTPTFIIHFNNNERRIQGAQPYQNFVAIIDSLLDGQGTESETPQRPKPQTWWEWLWQ